MFDIDIMDPANFSSLIALLALLLAGFVFFRCLLLRRKVNRLKRKLAKANLMLDAARTDVDELRAKYTAGVEFQNNLADAEITTRFQQPRLFAQHRRNNVEAPERYQYVRTLVQKGMEPEEIASILSLSRNEAEQLVNLSRLADVQQ